MFGIIDKINEYIKGILVDSIKANLEAMFIDVNTKVTEAATNIGRSPMGFNSDVFSFIKSINDNVVIPIAGLIITAILCIELINMVMQKNNMSDTDTFDFFKYIIKMFVAVYLVSHAFEFTMAVFDLAQHMINNAAGVIHSNASLNGTELIDLVEALKELEVGSLIGILIETMFVRFFMLCLSLVIMLIVYGRMFEIYIYASVSAIPFATMGNREWGQIGHNYIKTLFALALQGLFLLICLGIYAVLVKSLTISDIHSSILSMLGYAVLLGFMMFKSGAIAKSILNAH